MPLNTLSKRYRIRRKDHFQHVFDSAKRVENGILRVYFLSTDTSQGSVAFVAGKKLGKAVFRNQCKRRLREIYRLNQGLIDPKFDFILMAKRPLMTHSYVQATQWFLTLLKNNSLLKSPAH